MDPRRQGRLVHEVFETFFSEWQAAGRRAITPANIDEAREIFAAVVDRSLEGLPVTEAALERTRLLGSSAASGLGEAVLRMEAERPIAVVDRLLEHRLEGEFTVDDRRRPAHGRAARQGRPDRPARGRHVPPDRLQARLAARTRRVPCSFRSTPLRGSSGSPAGRGATGRSAKPAISPSRGRGASCRCSSRRRIGPRCMADAQARLVATLDADLPRRVSADARRRVSMRELQLRVGVPKGLRR